VGKLTEKKKMKRIQMEENEQSSFPKMNWKGFLEILGVNLILSRTFY